MGRKATVTKEQLLEAAYAIMDEDGYSNVNIKSIAARIGCSTQPVSWHFGSMPQLRRELYGYCQSKFWCGFEEKFGKMDAVDLFFDTGKNYLGIAFDHPKVFRFLYVDDPLWSEGRKVDPIEALGDPTLVSQIAAGFGVEAEKVAPVVRDVIIYTHGLAMFVMVDSLSISREEAYGMIYNEGRQRLLAIGIDIGEMK